jgi:hypothetical protein
MNATFKFLSLVGSVLLVAIVLVSAGRTDQPPSQKEASVGAAKPFAEAHAPLLLDASFKLAVKRPAEAENSPERKDLILPPDGSMNVTMDELVDGRPLSTIKHAGKTYLPVRHMGEEYQIRVWNHGPRRVGALVSVDGLSVITGRPASVDDPGYIIAPYSHILIKGWRRSLDNVAAFRFVGRDKSYASLMGKPENIGVIGLVAYEEQIIYPMPQLEQKESAPAAKGYRTLVGSIGTEYGHEIDSRAYYVPFVRSDQQTKIIVYYDTVEALRAAGVPVDAPLPNPFPGDLPFAPPPPAYREK